MRSPVQLTAPQLQQLIRDATADSIELGIRLNLEYPALKTLMNEHGQRRRVEDSFTDMCERFLDQKEGRTWEVVYKALESRENRRLMAQLQENYPPNTQGIALYYYCITIPVQFNWKGIYYRYL